MGASARQDLAADPQSRIFISYRRGDTSGEAQAIRERLSHYYGRRRVFMDTDSIEPGADFVKRINEELDSTGMMLVLIGRSWLGRGKRRLIDRPDDWVGLEIGAALGRDIPMIPILVEGTPLPSSEDLPESLRPLLTKQTVSLDNSSFDSDMARVEKAVATHVPLEVEEEEKGGVKHQPRRWAFYGAGAALIAAIVAGILLVRPHPNPGPKPLSLITASTAVREVPSSDLLTLGLLTKGFVVPLPANVSPDTPQLSDIPNGLAHPGLAASIRMGLNGPANDMAVWYYVFQDEGSASRFFYTSHSYPNGYRPVGRLTAAGVGDHTECQIAQQKTPRLSSWGCLSLSGNVVSFSEVIGENESSGHSELEKKLARDTISNLLAVATTTSHEPLNEPPGMTSSMVMTGNDLYRSLIRPFPEALLPAGLPSPTVHHFSFGGPLPPGLLSRPSSGDLRVAFGQDDHNYLFFYIFDTARHAGSWFTSGLAPVDPSGHLDSLTGSLSKPSGFSTSQHVQCGTYSQPGLRGTPAMSVASCFVQWGNVVIFSRNQTALNHGKGSTDLALALARSGTLRVAQVIAP